MLGSYGERVANGQARGEGQAGGFVPSESPTDGPIRGGIGVKDLVCPNRMAPKTLGPERMKNGRAHEVPLANENAAPIPHQRNAPKCFDVDDAELFAQELRFRNVTTPSLRDLGPGSRLLRSVTYGITSARGSVPLLEPFGASKVSAVGAWRNQ